MKIAITGKGGVGKTTLAGTLARLFARDGYTVLAVDADPDANLAAAIGFPEDMIQAIAPLASMKELAEERTGSNGTYGSLFVLNPRVDDLPEALSVQCHGVKLLTMGTVDKGGSGCVCAENTLVRRLMQHLLVQRNEVVIMDMEAGVEHLGRGTAEFVDALIVVVEPGKRSIQTAKQIKELARDISIRNLFVVASKVRSEQDVIYIQQNLTDFCLLGAISFQVALVEADMMGRPSVDIGGEFLNEVQAIKSNLLEALAT